MRVAVNIEFTDEELRKHAEDVGRRWVVNAIHAAIQHLPALKVDPSVVNGLTQVMASIAAAASEKKDSGPIPKVDARFDPPTKCERVEASPFFEEGWSCHKCSTFNGEHRVVCRVCKHERCDVVVPPPPAPPPPEPGPDRDPFGPEMQ